jgi:hypothetical protein
VRLCTSDNGRLRSMVVTFIEVKVKLTVASLTAKTEINARKKGGEGNGQK